MNPEQHLKNMVGDLIFQIATLLAANEALRAELATLKPPTGA
jgi:hypothetical protein